MIVIKKLENRFIILVLTLFTIFMIGFLDYFTSSEFSFSLFYLIPISFLALYQGTKASSVLACAILSSILWFLADYNNSEYSKLFFPIWNGFVRLFIFTSIGLLVLYLKEKDKRLKQVNSNLKVLNEEKNKFIGIAAHDLRTPIGGINSLSDLLIEENESNTNPQPMEVLQLIKTMSENTLLMLNNLLDVSKIESGKIELILKTQDYLSFIKHQISLSQLAANRKNISIYFDCQIHNSLMIQFDGNYLAEVTDNLLSNAIKYSFSKSEIVVKITLLENKQILTEIIDNGQGIPENEQQKLFNYFQTTSTRPTEGEQSTGLGLAIAKRIVLLHKGEIGLKSELNKGSNFYFILPNPVVGCPTAT